MIDQEVRLVFLETETAGLIVTASTAVFYEMQTGGYACIRGRAEGFYVPLSLEVVDHYVELHRHFAETLQGMCSDGIDDATAQFIDAELKRLPGHAGIVVDRTRLSMSRESWVYVNIENPTLDLLFRGFATPLAAILLWPNSD